MCLGALGIIQSEKLRKWLGRKGGESTWANPPWGLPMGDKRGREWQRQGGKGHRRDHQGGKMKCQHLSLLCPWPGWLLDRLGTWHRDAFSDAQVSSCDNQGPSPHPLFSPFKLEIYLFRCLDRKSWLFLHKAPELKISTPVANPSESIIQRK